MCVSEYEDELSAEDESCEMASQTKVQRGDSYMHFILIIEKGVAPLGTKTSLSLLVAEPFAVLVTTSSPEEDRLLNIWWCEVSNSLHLRTLQDAAQTSEPLDAIRM